jgi:hypothetical protein
MLIFKVYNYDSPFVYRRILTKVGQIVRHAAAERKWKTNKSEVTEWYDHCEGIPENGWPLWVLMDVGKKH